MNIKKLLTIVGVLAILVAALPVGAAFAQRPSDQNPPLGLGRGNWGGLDNSLIAVAAKVLGMDQTALVAELNTGKTIAQVAQAKGVALDTIVTAFVQPHVDWLNQAVEDGKITQTQADQYIATMKANLTAKLSAPFAPRGNGNGQGFVDANGGGASMWAARRRRAVKVGAVRVCAARKVKTAAWDAGINSPPSPALLPFTPRYECEQGKGVHSLPRAGTAQRGGGLGWG